MWKSKPVRLVVDSAFLFVLAAILSGWLLRVAPGSSVDAREADPRYTFETLAKLRAQREADRAAAAQSLSWFLNALRGDFGVSETTGEPVSSMLAERTPYTIRTVLVGAASGFSAGLVGAAVSTFARGPGPGTIAIGASIGILAIPSGLLALFAVFLRLPVELAVAVCVAPRSFLYASELFAVRARSGWMLSAHASGIPLVRIFVRYLIPSAGPELAAVAGLAVLSALAVAIPAEVLTGRPGLGQLAWQSATERDLPVVIAVTLRMLLIARSVTLLSSLHDRTGGRAS